MKNRINKKNLIPKKDRENLLKIKKVLLDIEKMLNEGKKEAERIDKEKEKEKNIIIFQKDE